MDFVQKTLEDVFLELTKEYQAPEKKKHRLSKKEKIDNEIEDDELTEKVTESEETVTNKVQEDNK